MNPVLFLRRKETKIWPRLIYLIPELAASKNPEFRKVKETTTGRVRAWPEEAWIPLRTRLWARRSFLRDGFFSGEKKPGSDGAITPPPLSSGGVKTMKIEYKGGGVLAYRWYYSVRAH